MMTGLPHHTVDTNGIRMHVVEQGAGPVVVLCHGFPESWYSWRHQLQALAEGGLNWYRNIDRNWELLAPFAGARVTVPALYVAGDRDLVVAFRGMDQLIPNLSKLVPRLARTLMLPGCGHWTQQERPHEVNAAMITFLKSLPA
jgi:pimeloyl-ACP methyl ester carboxylesterase